MHNVFFTTQIYNIRKYETYNIRISFPLSCSFILIQRHQSKKYSKQHLLICSNLRMFYSFAKTKHHANRAGSNNKYNKKRKSDPEIPKPSVIIPFPDYVVTQLGFRTSKATIHQFDTNLSPTIEAISVVIKNSLQKLAGSLNTNIPTNTEPTAPIPVHTA